MTGFQKRLPQKKCKVTPRPVGEQLYVTASDFILGIKENLRHKNQSTKAQFVKHKQKYPKRRKFSSTPPPNHEAEEESRKSASGGFLFLGGGMNIFEYIEPCFLTKTKYIYCSFEFYFTFASQPQGRGSLNKHYIYKLKIYF